VGARRAPPPGILHGMTERGDLVRMGAILVGLLVVTGAVLLATGSGGGGSPSVQRGTVDGTLLSASQEQGIVVQPSGGGPVQRFAVRPIDVRRLDFFHLQDHASQKLPSRVFYEQEGGQRYAVRVDDL
jgi:hypothetical protein